MTAWLWLLVCYLALGTCYLAAEAWAARRHPVPDPKETDDADAE